jgi:hypothetical protein
LPVIASSAYNTASQVLNRARAAINDARIPGGDVLTDGAPFTFEYLNSAFEHIQYELALSGIETLAAEVWMLAVPVVPFSDPATRVLIDDTGTHIVTATGASSSNQATPILPVDMVAPLRLWERANGATDPPSPMKQPSDGLTEGYQCENLLIWEWLNDAITMVGATRVQDLRLRYEKHLAQLSAVTDPLPIRGVENAAAFFVAEMFAEARGSELAAGFGTAGDNALFQFRGRSARRNQHSPRRRKPFSYRTRRTIF